MGDKRYGALPDLKKHKIINYYEIIHNRRVTQ